LGLRVIAIDANPAAPGLSLADQGLVIDIAHEETVIKVAERGNVSLVIPAPIGRYLTTVGAVNDALGLRGITRQAAVNCVDKAAFHNLLLKAHLERPRQVIARGRDSLLCAIDRLDVPFVLKPRFGSGGRGVIVVQSKEEIEKAVDEHLHEGAGEFDSLIEEVVNGHVIGLDGAVIDSCFVLTLMREKILTPTPYRVEIGYLAPARLGKSLCEAIDRTVGKCAKLLGLSNCLVHADLIVRSDGLPVVVQIDVESLLKFYDIALQVERRRREGIKGKELVGFEPWFEQEIGLRATLHIHRIWKEPSKEEKIAEEETPVKIYEVTISLPEIQKRGSMLLSDTMINYMQKKKSVTLTLPLSRGLAAQLYTTLEPRG